MDPKELARYIDSTLLKPEATEREIAALCEEALKYNFRAVCVNPVYIRLAAQILDGSETIPITVVGFPLGASETSIKAEEARVACRAGAREIDMVINIGALKSGLLSLVRGDIWAIVNACNDYDAPVKVILETSKLTDAEKITACELAQFACASFVKTSTGFGGGGATVEDIELMRKAVGPDMGIKASGGVRTLEDALAIIAASANRLGTSSGAAIVEAARAAKQK